MANRYVAKFTSTFYVLKLVCANASLKKDSLQKLIKVMVISKFWMTNGRSGESAI